MSTILHSIVSEYGRGGQARIAEAIGKSTSSVSNVINGKAPMPAAWIPVVSTVLGVTELEVTIAAALDRAGVHLELGAFRRVLALIAAEATEAE